jgi:hypothetical protein
VCLAALLSCLLAPASASAHYFSLLVLQGQAMGYLISDPLGRGSDLFGTSNFLVNYNLISFAVI